MTSLGTCVITSGQFPLGCSTSKLFYIQHTKSVFDMSAANNFHYCIELFTLLISCCSEALIFDVWVSIYLTYVSGMAWMSHCLVPRS